MDRVDHPFRLGEVVGFHFGGRGDPVFRTDHDRRRIELIEAQVGDVGGDVVQAGAALNRVGREQYPSGLFDGLDDFIVVERVDKTQVDQFDAQAVFGFQFVNGFHSAVENGAERDEREVGSFNANRRLALFGFVVPFRNAVFFEQFAHAIGLLRFEEDDGVGSCQREVEHAFGVACGGWIINFQPRNMGDHGSPVLRMLRTVFVPDGNTKHERHFQNPSGHRLPFGNLVKDLITGTAHKVAVHQLDTDASAAQRVSAGRSNNRAFGDGRVEQAMIRNGFGETVITGKRPTPVAVFFAVRNHRRIGVEPVSHRFENSIAIGVQLVG